MVLPKQSEIKKTWARLWVDGLLPWKAVEIRNCNGRSIAQMVIAPKCKSPAYFASTVGKIDFHEPMSRATALCTSGKITSRSLPTAA